MLDERFVYLAAAFNLVGTATYVNATLRGRTRPNRVSWFVWALAPLVGFGASLDEGVGLSALMTFMIGFGPALVLVASFVNPKASWRITRLDLACGALSLVAIAVWLGAGQGMTAVALTVAADGLAAVPTLLKAYRQPHTESPWLYGLSAASGGLTVLTIDTWDVAHVGFPLYVLTLGTLLAVLIVTRVGERRTAASRQPSRAP